MVAAAFLFTATMFLDVSLTFSDFKKSIRLEQTGEVYVQDENVDDGEGVPFISDKEEPLSIPPSSGSLDSGNASQLLLSSLPIALPNGYIASAGFPAFESFLPLQELQMLYMGGFTPETEFPSVRLLKASKQKRILVTGGAGFVGSHLIDRLMKLGHYVLCLDNLVTGDIANVARWVGHPYFELINKDVTLPFLCEVDEIYHLASSQETTLGLNNVKMLKTLFLGTQNVLGLATRIKAKLLIVSSCDVYGDVSEAPQEETYHGAVRPDDSSRSKAQGHRIAETLAYSYRNQANTQVAVVRLFETIGPRMKLDVRRSAFSGMLQSLVLDKVQSFTLNVNPAQEVSLLYIHDAVDGLINAMQKMQFGPFNIGNPSTIRYSKLVDSIKAVWQDLSNNQVAINLNRSALIPKTIFKPRVRQAVDKLEWKPYFTIEQSVFETVGSLLAQN